MNIESEVRGYCRSFPAQFDRAEGTKIISVHGKPYLDFLSGCGTLNYGHNPEKLRTALIEYISESRIAMSLDFETSSKVDFMKTFQTHILKPRKLDFKLQFPGPTGTNAIEAAIKLARKKTKRSNIIAFTNGFHGCSLGSLALTGNKHHRGGSSAILSNVTRAAFDGYFGPDVDTVDQLDKLLSDPSAGIDPPAAIVFEPIQGEGGINIASREWATKLQQVARKHGALLIADEIQCGCGRSGDFFAFENLNIDPDIVVLAKALSGFGLPMSLVLLKPEHDVWEPGEHNGTFRGNNHAFVTATTAIEMFWRDERLVEDVRRKSCKLANRLNEFATEFGLTVKGRGLMFGLKFSDANDAKELQTHCFHNGLIMEVCGPNDEVLKFLPPLTVLDSELDDALDIIWQGLLSLNGNNQPRVVEMLEGAVV